MEDRRQFGASVYNVRAVATPLNELATEPDAGLQLSSAAGLTSLEDQAQADAYKVGKPSVFPPGACRFYPPRVMHRRHRREIIATTPMPTPSYIIDSRRCPGRRARQSVHILDIGIQSLLDLEGRAAGFLRGAVLSGPPRGLPPRSTKPLVEDIIAGAVE